MLQKPLAEAIVAVPDTEGHFHRMAAQASLEGIGKSLGFLLPAAGALQLAVPQDRMPKDLVFPFSDV